MSIRNKLVTAACLSGGYQLARFLTRSQPRALMFHRFSADGADGRVSTELFDRQISELKRNFSVQPLSLICESLRTGRAIPPNSVVLTIDDGYDDFYRFAFPVLKKYGLPATLYVTADFVDRKLWLWPDKIAHVLKTTPEQKFSFTTVTNELRSLSLVNASERSAAWPVLNRHCLSIGHEERQQFLQRLADDLQVTLTDEPAADYAPMSWSAVCELADNGIEIGAHSRTHPVLSNLDRDRLREEIYGSKTRIEHFINRPVTAFCYPNGQRNDYNDLVKQVVIESGFASATVAFHDKAGWQDLYEIRRNGVSHDMVQFRKALYGIEYLSDIFQ